jgi:hypothetical protein
MQKAVTYIGLDVHKDSIVVSVAEAGLRGRLREVREYGKVPTHFSSWVSHDSSLG